MFIPGICDVLLADLAASVKAKSEVSEKEVLATVKKIFPAEINKHAFANANQSLYREKVCVVFNGSVSENFSYFHYNRTILFHTLNKILI